MGNLSFDNTLAGKIVEKTRREDVFKETDTEYFSERVINSYIYNNNNIATLSNIENDNPNYFLEIANERIDDGKFNKKTLYCFYKLSEQDIGLAFAKTKPSENDYEAGKEITFTAIEYDDNNKTDVKIEYKYSFGKIGIGSDFTVDYGSVKITSIDSSKNTTYKVLNLAEGHRIVTITNNGDYSFNYAIKDVKNIEEVDSTYYLNTIKYIFDCGVRDKLPKFKKTVTEKKLKYIGFYFTSPTERKAQRLLFSVDKFNSDGKYFYPTVFSWVDGTEGTTATCEYIKPGNEIGEVDASFGVETTPKKIYATVTYSISAGLKKEDVKDAVVGFIIDDPAIDVETDECWADQLASTNKKISFLGNSYDKLYYYRITYRSEGGETFTKLTYKKPDVFNITTNARVPRTDFLCKNAAGENIVLEENTAVEVGQQLYYISLDVRDFDIKTTVDGQIKYDGLTDNLKSESGLQGDWKVAMSAKGIDQLKKHEGWVPYFYCCPAGVITIGYGHTHSPGYNVEKEADEATLWSNLKIYLLKKASADGATFKTEKGQWILEKNGERITTRNYIRDTLGYNVEIDKALGTKLLNRVIKVKSCETFAWILRRFLTTRQVKDYNYDKNDRSITTAQKLLNNALHSTKGNNDFIRKLTQTQFDDIVNMMFQGSAGHLGDYIVNNGYQGGSYEKICRGIVKCVKEQIGSTGYLFRNNEFRKKLIKDFTVSSSSSSEETEENKPTVEKKIEDIIIEAIAEEKMTIVSKLKLDIIKNKYKHVVDPTTGIDNNHEQAAYYVNVEKVEEEEIADTEGIENLDTEEQVDWEEVKKFVNKWSFNYTANQNIKEQDIRDVKNYYDFYSGMTPFVEIYFRDNYCEEIKDEKGNVKEIKLKWNVINSIDHPYIKSLKVEDKGVKKAQIQLFDKDFASYQFGILKAFDDTGSKNNVVYSLDTLIKRSLMTPELKTGEQKRETYNEQSEETQDLQEEYLKISEYSKTMGPGNLRIRFGYCDDNQPIPKDSNDNEISKYFKTNYILQDPGNDDRRTHRWWDVKANKPEDANTFSWKHKINNNKLDSGETKLVTQTAEIVAIDNNKTIVADAVKRRSPNSTTKLSYVNEYMIVGYKSSLKSNGIFYDIDAIEVKNVEVMRKRFLQRYAEITTYPLEILYILMHIFNENNDGKIIDSGIKLLFMNEDNYFKNNPANGFNMSFDFSNLKKEDIAELSDVKDTVYAYKNKGGVIFDEYLKKATLSFGGETALANYSNSAEEKRPSVYKSVESLMNEFCALCPSKKDYSDDEPKKAHDKDGIEIKTEDKSSVSGLTWLTAKSKDDKDKNIYIIFYYKKIRKQQCIKRYIWGPANPYKSIVKDLQIENNNEFAMMSSVTSSTFDGSGNIILSSKENTKNSNINSKQEMKEIVSTVNTREKLKAGEGFSTDYIAGTIEQGDKINTALANCMYTGTMTVLGDPAMEFNLEIQPYTYPIYIEVLVPINDAYWDKEINNKFKEYDDIYHGVKLVSGSNQKVHEMTGFYVVTSIEHNISSSGYTTTLGVSRYPNIEKDVLTEESLEKYRKGTLIVHNNLNIVVPKS